MRKLLAVGQSEVPDNFPFPCELLHPPADTRAATWRLAIGLALLFALAPAARFGYFAYPGALLGWLAITARSRAGAEKGTAPGVAAAAATPAEASTTGPAAAEATATETTATGAASQGATTTPVPSQPTPTPGPPAAKLWLRWWRAWRSRPATGNASGGR